MREIAALLEKAGVPDTKKLIAAVITKNKQAINEMSNDKNPQVVAIVTRMRAELDLAEAILMALNGNPAQLRIYI